MSEIDRPMTFKQAVAKTEANNDFLEAREAARHQASEREVAVGGFRRLRRAGAAAVLASVAVAVGGNWVNNQAVEHSSVRNYDQRLEQLKTPPTPPAPTLTVPGQR